MGSNDLVDCQTSEQTTWQKIECAIRYNLAQFENGRKFCAYCGKKEESQAIEHCIILGRCYGCQMVYYCSQEHQNSDWLEHHMPKCAELEWVALGELIQSIPANPALTNIGMFWPENYYPHTWTDWFEIRPDLVQIAKQTAMILEQNQQVKFILNKFNRREPSNTDLVDGLLAAVTDSITYALTIGDCLIKTGINPNLKPVCIHLLHPPFELIDDLDYLFSCLEPTELYERLDQLEINLNIKKKFYELCNMFPLNKGIEIVFISSVSMFKQNEFSFDWSKVLKAPFMKTQLHKSLPLSDKNLYISAWQGSYSNYIKYACQIEGYSHPDLVVSFHPGFTSSPHKLINDWTDDLKIILTNNFPCLFTFYDKEENQKAFNILSAFQSHFLCAQSNQFSSLLLKQMQAKPNHVYASNSFLIVIKGFVSVETDSRYNQAINFGILNEKCLASTDGAISVVVDSKDNPKPKKSIHSFLSFHNQQQQQQQLIKMQQNRHNNFNDASIQTLGLEEPENFSLRHINGKLQINKFSNYSSHTNQETSIKTNVNPELDFSAYPQGSSYYYEKQQSKLVNDQLDCDENELKVNFRLSNFLNKSQFQSKKDAYLHINNHYESNFYHQQQQQQNIHKDQFQMNNKLLMQSISQFKQDKISSTHMAYNRLLNRPSNPNFPEYLKNTCMPVSLLREESVNQPPPLKPRINICQTLNITPGTVNHPAILDMNDNINSIPSTKPRMRPTRIYDKYTSCLKALQPPSPSKEAQDQPELNQPTNPLPKPRNSIHLISEPKNDSKLNSQSYSSSEYETQNESDFNKTNKMHEKPLIFKASILKVNKKNQDYLQVSPSSSSSSSPSSSTSALSLFSPRSNEDQTQNHSSNSTSSSASSSQGVTSSSSISSFNSLSTKQNSGFVNQMKNIFESQQHQNQQQHLDLKKNHHNINEKNLKQSTIVQQENLQLLDKEAGYNNNIEPVEPQSEYMNVSNKYLNFLKQQQLEKNRSSPPNTPPPLPPSSPPISRSPSPANQQEKQQSKSNMNNDLISLISSPFKPTNDKLVSKIISNSNTQLTTLTTTTTTTTTFSSAINQNSKQLSGSSNRLISNLSSLNHAPLKLNNSSKSEFRILNNNPSITNNSDRSATTLSGKSSSSLSQSNNNLYLNNRIMLNHIPDSVDIVQFQYEGQRRVVVPGYMTSADILRNMLLNSNNTPESMSPLDGGLDPSKAPIIIQRKTTTMSLKEKLLMQNESENNSNGVNKNSFQPFQSQVSFQSQRVTQVPLPTYEQRNQHQELPVIPKSIKKQKQLLDDDEKLDRKFERSRTRSMSGIVTLDLASTQNTQIIDIDLDYEAPKSIENVHDRVEEIPSHLIEAEPNSINENYNVVPKQTINREIKPSIRINQLLKTNVNNSTENGSIKSSGYSRRIPSNLHRQSVTGSFDPNDFDSFDEDDNNSYLANSSNCTEQTKFSLRPKAARQIESNPSSIQIESMEKIRESAILQQILEQEREKQQMNLVQFDPDDFDSFDEEENEQLNQNNKQNQEALPVIQLNFEQKDENDSREKRQLDFLNNRKKLEEIFRKNEYSASPKKENTFELISIEEPIVINYLDKTENISNDSANTHYSVAQTKNTSNPSGGSSNFFRSAIDRISSRNGKNKSENKARSSSVPLRTLISSNLEITSPTEDSNIFLKQQQSKPPQPQQRSNLLKPSTSTKKPEAISQLANMKTLQLLNKMQSEFDEKQKRRKLRREQKSKEEKLPSKSSKSSSSDRKFLSSIMNTIFSTSYSNINDSTSSSNNEIKPSLQKNDAKRLSLRKLKAKDKAKKKNESLSGDEQETMISSNRSLNLIHTNHDQNREDEEQEFEKNEHNLQFMRSSSFDTGSLGKLTSIQFQPTSIGASSISSRFGKIKNETDKPKNENNKENLMKQLKAELDEEIKDRRMLELKNNIINGTCNRSTTASTSSNSSNYSNRQSLKDSSQLRKKQEKDNNNHKIRSKSVTFLDEISTDDEIISMSNSPKIYTVDGSNSMPYSTPQLQQRQIIPNGENINFYTPIASRKPTKTKVKSGDVRMMCGALTGVGPIRSIMKKSATDLSLTLNTPSTSKSSNEKHNNINQLPSIQLGEPYAEYDNIEEQNENYKYLKTTINEAQPNIKRRDLMQSDL